MSQNPKQIACIRSWTVETKSENEFQCQSKWVHHCSQTSTIPLPGIDGFSFAKQRGLREDEIIYFLEWDESSFDRARWKWLWLLSCKTSILPMPLGPSDQRGQCVSRGAFGHPSTSYWDRGRNWHMPSTCCRRTIFSSRKIGERMIIQSQQMLYCCSCSGIASFLRQRAIAVLCALLQNKQFNPDNRVVSRTRIAHVCFLEWQSDMCLLLKFNGLLPGSYESCKAVSESNTSKLVWHTRTNLMNYDRWGTFGTVRDLSWSPPFVTQWTAGMYYFIPVHCHAHYSVLLQYKYTCVPNSYLSGFRMTFHVIPSYRHTSSTPGSGRVLEYS
jgi:hypothetical protein